MTDAVIRPAGRPASCAPSVIANRLADGSTFEAARTLDLEIAPLIGRRPLLDCDARAAELIAAVGLAGRENALPSQLFGGQQQRVAITRALVARPGLVLADAPTGNLDSATAHDILHLLRELQSHHDTTLVVAIHDRDITEQADVVLHLRDGSISSVRA